MKNILTHNKIKKQNIIKKEYIAKVLSKIPLELEDDNLEWLKYVQFKIKLKIILEEEQGNNNLNTLVKKVIKLNQKKKIVN